MKIITICLLQVMIVLPWLLGAGMVHAASVNQAAAVKKIKHPCARRSATQINKQAAPYLKSIQAHARKYGVDSDLVKSVITIESCYRKKARSHKGAQGLMQLIPATAKRFGIKNAYDSHQNIKGGTRYLAWLSNRFNGDLKKVLAGYNAGEGKVDRYNGIPPYRETRHYVHDVLVVYKKLKQLKQPKAQAPTTTAKPAATLTPQQRRQAQLRKQQQLRQQAHQKLQQQRLAQARRQLKPKPGERIVFGKPGKPVYTNRPQTQTVVGKPPLSPAAQKAAQQKALAARRPQQANFLKGQVRQLSGGRVRSVFAATKPGRGGWLANKALAPQLFKQ